MKPDISRYRHIIWDWNGTLLDDAWRIVQHHHIQHFFNGISGLDDHHAAGKTANARAMIRNLPLPPAAVLLIGDTVHDVAVAAEIGVDCLLVPGGHQDERRLAASGARQIGCLSELLPGGG